MSESIYYLVGPESAALAVINECIADREVAKTALEKFRTKVAASALMVRGGSGQFVGVRFDGVLIPEGWRYGSGLAADLFVPNKRSKAGKALAEEIAALPQGIDGLQFTGRLEQETGQTFTHWAGNTFAWSGFEVYGDKVILGVPVACKDVPSGCTELKMSEFHKIYEDFEAAEKEKAA